VKIRETNTYSEMGSSVRTRQFQRGPVEPSGISLMSSQPPQQKIVGRSNKRQLSWIYNHIGIQELLKATDTSGTIVRYLKRIDRSRSKKKCREQESSLNGEEDSQKVCQLKDIRGRVQNIRRGERQKKRWVIVRSAGRDGNLRIRHRETPKRREQITELYPRNVRLQTSGLGAWKSHWGSLLFREARPSDVWGEKGDTKGTLRGGGT